MTKLVVCDGEVDGGESCDVLDIALLPFFDLKYGKEKDTPVF